MESKPRRNFNIVYLEIRKPNRATEARCRCDKIRSVVKVMPPFGYLEYQGLLFGVECSRGRSFVLVSVGSYDFLCGFCSGDFSSHAGLTFYFCN